MPQHLKPRYLQSNLAETGVSNFTHLISHTGFIAGDTGLHPKRQRLYNQISSSSKSGLSSASPYIIP